MTKLLYDISLLGIAHRNQSASGLMRAAENLLLALIAENAVDLTLCSSLSFNVWRHCQGYMQQNAAVHPFNFVKPEARRAGIYQKLATLTGSNGKANTPDTPFAEKLLNRLIEINFKPLRRADFADVDVYHSPYHTLPKQVRQAKHIKCFLTIYDIIPMIHPEYFGLKANFTEKNFDREFNLLAALNRLDRDSRIICCSESTRNDVCNYLGNKIDSEKTMVIPLAASELFYPCRDAGEKAAMRQKYGIPDGPYLLSLSTLEPRKNIEHIIRCFTELALAENMPDLSLVLAGSPGWDYEPIFAEVAKFPHIRKRIILPGYVADADLAALYSDALVFVYPSFYEGFGLPPLEAMQCGTPVITSNRSSLPEVMGDAGIMLDPNDKDGMCQHLLNIYQDSALCAEMARKSILQAKKFSWQFCARRTVDAYRKA